MFGTGGRLTCVPPLIGAENWVCPAADLLGAGKEDEHTTSEFNEPTNRVRQQAGTHSNYNRRTCHDDEEIGPVYSWLLVS